jgi:hypothetical protein
MRAYKAIEKPAKIFGLTLEDWLVIIGYIGLYVVLISILTEVGLPIKPLWNRLFLGLSIFILYRLMSWANKNKAPNYLIAWVSYHFLQNKHIDPICQVLKKKSEKSSSSQVLAMKKVLKN